MPGRRRRPVKGGTPKLAGQADSDSNSRRRIPVATYSYCDAAGIERFRKIRYQLDPPVDGRDKTFRILSPNPFGLWFPGMDFVSDDNKTLLYRLPEVLRAVERGQTVYWCEGEKDADSLAKIGYAATSHWGGMSVWAGSEAWLRGAKRVIICADRDRPGLRTAWARYERLQPLLGPARVGVYRAADGKDVTDHLTAGLQVTDLVQIPISWLRANAPKRSVKYG